MPPRDFKRSERVAGQLRRDLAKLIQTEIKDALSDEILFGKLKSGGVISVNLADDKLTFDYS